MPQLDARLTRLESSPAGVCTCANRLRIVYSNRRNAPAPDPGPATCSRCGGQRITLKVVYDSRQGGDRMAER
jgi:hypothetical protein